MPLKIDDVQCVRCAACVDVCPNDALLETASHIKVVPAACLDCGLCQEICPCGAIQHDSSP